MSKKKLIDKSNPENLRIEKELWTEGYGLVAGVDECGRGTFSGPVVAGAAVMPVDFRIERLTDSKDLAKKEHKYFSDLVKEKAISWSVAEASVEEIDSKGIEVATKLAMTRAIEKLNCVPTYILVDGRESVYLPIPQKSVIKGDHYSHSIAAGSILAKTYRDELMANLDEEYGNVYGWAKNAGYQTKAHVEACHKHGLTPHHRRSWKTINLFK